MLHLVEDLAADWRRLDARNEGLSSEIERLARQDKGCRAADDGPWHWPDHLERDRSCDRRRRCFLESRDFGTWLGLVPKQISTGDGTILGSISRRGDLRKSGTRRRGDAET
jgi:transposase